MQIKNQHEQQIQQIKRHFDGEILLLKNQFQVNSSANVDNIAKRKRTNNNNIFTKNSTNTAQLSGIFNKNN